MKIYYLLLFMLLVLIVPASAIIEYKSDKPVNIVTSCTQDGMICGASTSCYIDILWPNGTIMILNRTMSRNSSIYNYTLNYTNLTGLYTAAVSCIDGTDGGYESFQFRIKPSDTFNALACPLETDTGRWTTFVMLGLLLIFVIFSMISGSMIFGLLSSVGLLLVALSFYGCSVWMGIITGGISILLIIYFIWKKY